MKMTVPQAITVTATQITSFSWSRIPQYLEHGPPKITKKKRNHDELDPSFDLGIEDPTYLKISDMVLFGETQVNEETVNAITGLEFVNQEVNLRLRGNKLEILTKKRYKLNEFVILGLQINDNLAAERISHELRLIRANRFINIGYLRLDQHPILSFAITDTNLKIELRYKISIVESLALNFPSQLRTNLRHIIEGHFQISKPDQIELSSKTFYDSVTEKTANYPKLSKPPFVAEMDCDLLPFQGNTVKWLLAREFCSYDEESRKVEPLTVKIDNTISDDTLKSLLNYTSFGFELINNPLMTESVWYNVYSANICSRETAVKFLGQSLQTISGRGILCEEMGLGKTVEMISLMLLNPRPPIKVENKQFLNVFSGKTVTRAKTTLIICPESIANQWVEEVQLHAPSLNVYVYSGLIKEKHGTPTEIAEKLASYDVVLTTYSTLQREMHNAQYNPERAKRLRKSTIQTPSYSIGEIDPSQRDIVEEMFQDLENLEGEVTRERKDRTSPLVLLEFWRLVLDEVQMVGSTASNCCKLATLIPRHHVWGASGTPIKNDINDLFSMVSFLRVQPFLNDNTSWKQMITNRSADYIKLFEDLTFRHTKEMVKDEIKLPRQERILLNIPFGPIEQDNYQELYGQFLNDVGLDEDGNPTSPNWEPSTSYYEAMKFWLKNLRRVCCHANFAMVNNEKNQFYGTAPNRHTSSYQTMDKVLARMIDGASDKIAQIERDISLSKLEVGQINEYKKYPNAALKIWQEEVPRVESRVDKIRKIIEASKKDDPDNEIVNDKNTIVLRSTLEVLHRFYYFIASAHYQIYNPPLEVVIPGIEHTLEEGQSAEDLVLHRALTEHEMRHHNLESEYYERAQEIRKEMLAIPIKAFTEASQLLKDDLKIPFINLQYYDLGDLESTVFTTRVKAVTAQLNSQGESLNGLTSKVIKILKTQLFDSVTDPSGEEYNQSLDDQTNAGVYLEFLQRALADRTRLALGNEGAVHHETIDTVIGSQRTKLHKELEDEFGKMSITHSMKSLLIDSKNLLNDLEKNPNAHRYMEDLVLQLKDEFDVQKETLEKFKKLFRHLNDVYNLRITYFRQLQELSDNVRPFEVYGKQSQDLDVIIRKLRAKITDGEEQIKSIQMRVRYLRSLSKVAEDDHDEDDRICAICRGTITIGSLTKCGHKYCRECLMEWLKVPRRATCPICNEIIYKSEVYNFTFNKDDINAVVNTEHKEGTRKDTGNSEIEELYQKLDQKNLNELSNIKLKHDYGAKINAIVRQVLFLKRDDPFVQIVVYSQWDQLLRVIANALTQNGINYLGSKNTLGYDGKGKRASMRVDITKFKKDSKITCFLLNAKADASGLNLVNATHVFLCEPLVQTALELQAIGRIHRIGQKKMTHVWMFSIKGSVEESIVLLTTRKKLEEKEKLETEEMTKTSKGLIETNGEFVSTDVLWSSFFSNKIASRVYE